MGAKCDGNTVENEEQTKESRIKTRIREQCAYCNQQKSGKRPNDCRRDEPCAVIVHKGCI